MKHTRVSKPRPSKWPCDSLHLSLPHPLNWNSFNFSSCACLCPRTYRGSDTMELFSGCLIWEDSNKWKKHWCSLHQSRKGWVPCWACPLPFWRINWTHTDWLTKQIFLQWSTCLFSPISLCVYLFMPHKNLLARNIHVSALHPPK